MVKHDRKSQSLLMSSNRSHSDHITEEQKEERDKFQAEDFFGYASDNGLRPSDKTTNLARKLSGMTTPERKLSDASALRNLRDNHVQSSDMMRASDDFKRLRRQTKESAKMKRKIEVLSAITTSGEFDNMRGNSQDGT